MGARVYSFDVFDTSLIRKLASPLDVFRLLGSLIARNANVADQNGYVEDFLSARIRAEQKARFDFGEITLDQIWNNLREMLPQLPPICGPADELDVERNQLLPNSIVAQQIARLRFAGARIIFTSDTYFPEEFVREQLLRHGLAEVGDRIYVSNAAGVAKWTGELFKAILIREGIAPKDLHHYGDDAASDVATPRRLGIKTTLLSHTHLNTWENAVLSKDVQYRMATSLLAGSMRAFRQSTVFQSTDGAGELVATLLGPALAVWAAWVLRTAQRDGIRRLYFVSRDAYLLCRAARILAPYFGDIDCRHLRISRQSMLLPATDEISPSKMQWLRRPTQPIRLVDLVQKLDLSWSNVAQHFSRLTKGEDDSWLLTTESEWNEFWDILRSPPVEDFIRDRIRNKRANVLAYLRAEGLCDKVPSGVVDLGWYMEVQSSLRKLLEQSENVQAPRGYYLGLCSTRMAPADSGEVTALFYEQPSYHHWLAPQYEVFRRIDFLDNVFGLAPYGSVSDYTISGSTVEPVGDHETKLHTEFVETLGTTIEAFCKSIYEDALWYSDNATAREVLEKLIAAWCFHPNKSALKALDHILVTDGTDAVPSQPLFRPWRLLDAAKTFIPARLHNRLGIKAFSPLWPEAAFYRSGIFVKFVLLLSSGLRLLRGSSRLELLTLIFKSRR